LGFVDKKQAASIFNHHIGGWNQGLQATRHLP